MREFHSQRMSRSLLNFQNRKLVIIELFHEDHSAKNVSYFLSLKIFCRGVSQRRKRLYSYRCTGNNDFSGVPGQINSAAWWCWSEWKSFFPHALSLAWQGRRGKVELNLNFYVVLWWIWLFLRNACFLANETPREGWAEGRWKWAPGNCIVFRWWELELKLCNWAKTARQGSDFEEAISSWWCRNDEDTLPPIGWWNWILLSWLSFVRRYGI